MHAVRLIHATYNRAAGRRRSGFSLLELIAVLAIVSLMCSVTVYCLSGPYQQARKQHVLERIAQLDEQLRTATRRFGHPGELAILFRDGAIETRHGSRGTESTQRIVLPADLTLDQVRTAVREENYGRIAIPFTTEGNSPTYALRIKSRDRPPEWFLFAGTTGQVIHVKNERDINAIFRRLAPGRADAP